MHILASPLCPPSCIFLKLSGPSSCLFLSSECCVCISHGFADHFIDPMSPFSSLRPGQTHFWPCPSVFLTVFLPRRTASPSTLRLEVSLPPSPTCRWLPSKYTSNSSLLSIFTSTAAKPTLITSGLSRCLPGSGSLSSKHSPHCYQSYFSKI